ncbi:MAG: hypothetical protein ACKOX6_18295 [Bdellovibrio sp.]
MFHHIKWPMIRQKIDAKGQTVLVKFYEGTWCCVGYQRRVTHHLSKKLAIDHAHHAWKNFVLKVIDHQGVIETVDHTGIAV